MTESDPTPLPDDWERGFVEANGIDLHYVRTGGGGPPLVVAHGVFDDAPCRTPLIRDLADEYDVIAYDARGHGRSDAPGEGYDGETQAADLLGLVDALDLEDPLLFGHSMGGSTVAVAAARRPDLPRAVVLVDPAGMLTHDDDTAAGERADAVRERIERWNDRTKAELLAEDDELRGHVEAGDEELASLLADARLRVRPTVASVFRNELSDPAETYPGIEAPTLVLKADADGARAERDRELAARLPDGRLVHVDGAGHCVFRDNRELATRELREFLSSHTDD